MEVQEQNISPSKQIRSGSPPPSLSSEEYNCKFWGVLRDAIDQMLSHPPGSYKPISYEKMYSAVYKCVCQQFSERLYGDLINHIKTRMAQWSNQLSTVQDDSFIAEFHKALVRYFDALNGIVPIFTYMNRFYIVLKLNTDLKTELLKIFSGLVSDPHITRLIPLMRSAQETPFQIPPGVMSTMCKRLYQLNPDYINMEAKLFSNFLPNVLPQMREEDLQTQREEDRLLQESLRAAGWGGAGTGGGDEEKKSATRKRDLEDAPDPPHRG